MAKQVKALRLNDTVALESDVAPRLHQSAAAPVFDATQDYPAGYHVTYDGYLYRFTSSHAAGAWTGNDVVLDDMTTPDAMLDLTSAGFLRVVSADGTVLWMQNTLSASRSEIAADFSASAAYSPPALVVYNGTLYRCTTAHPAGAWDATHFTPATVQDVLALMNTEIGGKADKPVTFTTDNLAALDAQGNPTDSGIPKSAVEPLIFAQYFPEGNVKSTAEFTSNIKYNDPNTTNRTITVKPFCNTGTAENDNSDLSGRVVIPPFVDASGNGYISDDGTKFKVVGVSEGSVNAGNTNLTVVIAPNTVTTIGGRSFFACSALTSVSIPAATTIGGQLFSYCSALTSVSFPVATTIGSEAFIGCSSLTSVSIPAATTIEGYAFGNCDALTSVSFPVATSIGARAFYECYSLTSVSLPAVATIGLESFYGSSLTSVSLPVATSIGDSAFYYCGSLASVSLPVVTTIGEQAFFSCYSLTSVSLPAATSIGYAALAFCSALTSVSLPVATTIGASAFYSCSVLTSVDFGDTPRSSVPSLGSDAFNSVPSACTIIVPYTQYDAWKAANVWKDLPQEFVRHAEKADKPMTFTTGNLAKFDANGNPVDSTIPAVNVALKSEIPYSLVTKTVANGAVTLDDHACNYVDATSLAALDIEFPTYQEGKMRDFLFAVECGAPPPNISYASYITIMAEDADMLVPEDGMNVYSFTEFRPNKFIAHRKTIVNAVVNVPQTGVQLLDAMRQKGISTTGVNTFGQAATALGLSGGSLTVEDLNDAVMG